MPVPKKVSLGPSLVVIEWSDGHQSVHSNKAMREACPCAMCRGEPAPLGNSVVFSLTPAAPEGVHALSYSMVGRYAISFEWSDGHGTGIYRYEDILESCECDGCKARKAAPRVE